MHVISRKPCREFWGVHPEAETPLRDWLRNAKQAEWHNFGELRSTFGSADVVGRFTIFNVGGNKFRLVAEVFYKTQVILVRGIYLHKDYDKLDLDL